MIFFLLNIKMPVTKSKDVDISEINFPNLNKKSSFQVFPLFYNNTTLYIQTPRLLSIFGMNINEYDKKKNIVATLQFNSDVDRVNRVDNYMKQIKKLDSLIKHTANKNHKTWLNTPFKIPSDSLDALYKPSLYYKKLPSGEYDHSVPPTKKVKFQIRKGENTFELYDKDSNNITLGTFDENIEFLEKSLENKSVIVKCILHPTIYIVDKNFGVTYNVKAFQLFDTYKSKKKQKATVEKKSKDINSYFASSKNDSSEDEDEDSDNDM